MDGRVTRPRPPPPKKAKLAARPWHTKDLISPRTHAARLIMSSAPLANDGKLSAFTYTRRPSRKVYAYSERARVEGSHPRSQKVRGVRPAPVFPCAYKFSAVHGHITHISMRATRYARRPPASKRAPVCVCCVCIHIYTETRKRDISASARKRATDCRDLTVPVDREPLLPCAQGPLIVHATAFRAIFPLSLSLPRARDFIILCFVVAAARDRTTTRPVDVSISAAHTIFIIVGNLLCAQPACQWWV